MNEKYNQIHSKMEQTTHPAEEELSSESLPMPNEYIEQMRESGLEGHAEAYKQVVDLCEIIKAEGGRALLVGGSVRDHFMGKISKDFDIEVYGLESNVIEEIISNKFGRVSDVGKAFGHLKVFLEGGIDIDVTLPRTDSKVSEGHKGFDIKTDPFMSIKEAARRRDFTMNTLAADPMSGEVFDYFGGIKDTKERRLKVTDVERFKDDPLRVMRAMQFVGRFGLEIDPQSVVIMQEMSKQLKEIAKERVEEEWKKLLLKSEKPSLGLAAGLSLGVLRELHPQLPPLVETPQEPDWHPEGDVWVHTLMVVDEAAKIIRRENIEDDKQKFSIMLASLCHDLGKPEVTEEVDGVLVSHGHEQAGFEPTQKFLAGIGIHSNNEMRKRVVKLVVNHMAPTMLYVNSEIRGNVVKDGAIRRLAERLHPATIRELVLLCEADHMGRGAFEPDIAEQMMLSPKEYKPGDWLMEYAARLAVEDSKPTSLTRGRDWIKLGFKPGVEFGKLIRLSDKLRDENNYTREMIFAAVDGAKTGGEAIKKLEKILESK
ncbi:MAG: HD domain-containing protein [Candidatus Magasanikbacteria bacterium]|nr:HD domain-containing protein [Candidatus Magasanikbacteria bacterium]